MKSWSSWVYLAVSMASVAFAALQAPHQAQLDEGLAAVARDGWAALDSSPNGSAQSR